MKINKPLTRCPVCSGEESITELTCNECGAKLMSRFQMCPVCRLPDEMYDLLMVFVKTRGSIKDMEKELGVSYPTVRARLDELQSMLGFQPGGPAWSAKEVLDKLEQGEVTAEEAEAMLKGTVK